MLTAGFAEPPVLVDGRVTRAFLVRTEDFDQTSLSTVIVRPALSVFLYRVDFNKTMRAAWSQVTAHEGVGPHLPLDLHFLLVDAVGRQRGSSRARSSGERCNVLTRTLILERPAPSSRRVTGSPTRRSICSWMRCRRKR